MKDIKERFQNVEKIGLEKNLFVDFYHRILTMSWPYFFALYTLIFVVFNLFFGFLYWLDASGVSGTDGDFFKDFSFSVQTFSTIGYGVFSPANYYSHTLVIIESLLSVIFTALLTGLAFSKFARPTARIRFTDKVVIQNYNGKKTLMFRLANLRGNQIAEAAIKAVVLKSEKTIEGHSMRIQKDVNFTRSTSSFFVLSWTVMHTIDESSPFYNMSAADIIKEKLEMSVSVIGHDETFSQTVHASCIYSPDDFIFDKNFADIITIKDGLAASMDFTQFNVLKNN